MQDKVLQKLIEKAADRLLSVRQDCWSDKTDRYIMADPRLTGKKDEIMAHAEALVSARMARWAEQYQALA